MRISGSALSSPFGIIIFRRGLAVSVEFAASILGSRACRGTAGMIYHVATRTEGSVSTVYLC